MSKDESLISAITQNLSDVQGAILKAARKSGRSVDDVKLITVTKKKSVEVITAAVQAGITRFGENYPEETEEKILALGSRYPDIEWHMIGHLQSRKSVIVANHFDMMHSLDSVRLAEKLGKALDKCGKKMPVLLEMNVSGEGSKGGWAAWDENRWDELIPEVEQILEVKSLKIKGLMTMPPLFEKAELVRPYFVKLRKLRDWMDRHFPQTDWTDLSMGTSADFIIAVEEGATFVRVGTAILGTRE